MSQSRQQAMPLAPVIAPRGPLSHALEPSELNLLRMALNHLDYGLVVVDADTGLVQFANALGQAALRDEAEPASVQQPRGSGLRLLHGRLMAQRAADNDLLRRTLERARAGLRGFLCLGEGTQSSAVAVLPLTGPRGLTDGPPHGLMNSQLPVYALLVFAKQQLCDESTMALFARERGLTNAEGQVLAQVCKGLRPAQIAHNHGVRISTVRTQLRSIRMKTCTQTIRDLVQKVSVLPPMARHMPGQCGN